MPGRAVWEVLAFLQYASQMLTAYYIVISEVYFLLTFLWELAS